MTLEKAIAFLSLLAVVGLSQYVNRSPNEPDVVRAGEPSRWTRVEIPLTIYHDKIHRRKGQVPGYWYLSAEGFWQSTSPSKERQVAFPTAIKITCYRSQGTCIESQAAVVLGELKADVVEYAVSKWTEDSISAEGDEGNCAIGHRLSLDFKSNSVTVTDYPKRVLGGDCRASQEVNSYALHGGGLHLSPPATWDPLH